MAIQNVLIKNGMIQEYINTDQRLSSVSEHSEDGSENLKPFEAEVKEPEPTPENIVEDVNISIFNSENIIVRAVKSVLI